MKYLIYIFTYVTDRNIYKLINNFTLTLAGRQKKLYPIKTWTIFKVL